VTGIYLEMTPYLTNHIVAPCRHRLPEYLMLTEQALCSLLLLTPSQTFTFLHSLIPLPHPRRLPFISHSHVFSQLQHFCAFSLFLAYSCTPLTPSQPQQNRTLRMAHSRAATFDIASGHDNKREREQAVNEWLQVVVVRTVALPPEVVLA